MDSKSPETPKSTHNLSSSWVGGETRCLHCHRRLRRTKRKKNKKR
jgi:hypothetical protein